MNMTSEQFRHLSELVYSECGINLHEGKQQLLQARLSKRLRSTGVNSVAEYMTILENDAPELMNFLDAVSTNHTYFFRESHHFEHLRTEHLKIWCAASSSGEEPYSVAIYCLEKGFKPSILATDISTRMLGIGQNGIYPIEKTKSLSLSVLKKYFQKGEGTWSDHVRVKKDIKQMVSFQRYNLLTDPAPTHEFDVIFCRNVFIYFDNITRTRIINKLNGALKKSGYFIIGASESLNTIDHSFKYIQPSIYRKV